MVQISTLKRRSEYQRVRGGGRWSAAAFIMEGKRREDGNETGPSGPRFGFTVTKKLGGAVVRNRIRRRLKAGIAALAAEHADAASDYVIVARDAAIAQPFDKLCADLAAAFRRVNAGAAGAKPRSSRATADSNVSRRR